MKTKTNLVLLGVLMCLGCDPRNAGPVGNFYNGSYRLDSYTIKGIEKPISEIPGYTLLETQQDADSTYFVFKDSKKNPTSKETFSNGDFDVNKDRTIGTYWFTTADGRKGKVSLNWNKPSGTPIRLIVNTFMEGEYNALKDTVRYFYLPN